MTLVHALVERPTNAGLIPARGSHIWQPTRRRIDPPNGIVMPSQFSAKIGADYLDLDGETVITTGEPGEYWIEVEPAGPDWVWEVTERVAGADQIRYFSVPDEAMIEYTELLENYQVDPDTLDPAAEPEAAWWTFANGLADDAADAVVSGTIVGDDLILTQNDGDTINAGDVRGPIGPGASDAEVAVYVPGPSATATAIEAKFAAIEDDLAGTIYIESYPRIGAETDDAPRLARAIAAAASSGAKVIQLAATTYTLASATTITAHHLTIRGTGQQSTIVNVTADVAAFNYSSASHPVLERFGIVCTTSARTVFPVLFTNCTRPLVDSMRFDATGAARHSGVRLTGASSTMGVIRGCVFNHSCILVETDDVKISNSWIWGMTCDYAIAIRGGAASTVIYDVDIVTPLASTATGIAGIVIGDDNSAPLNAKLDCVYLDGNPSLNTRAGIHVFNGVGGVILQAIHANEMDAESVIIDSAYNVMVNGYTSYHNNRQGNGSAEIRVSQTGAQPTENVLISNAHFLQTTAVVGTPGPAIKVDSGVSGTQVRLENFMVKEPSGGGGYSSPAIDVPISGGYPTVSMRGKTQLKVYAAVGSQSLSSGATGATINLGSPLAMAYRPRPGQIHLEVVGSASLPAHRIQYTTDNQIYVAFAAALGAATDIHWRTDLVL